MGCEACGSANVRETERSARRCNYVCNSCGASFSKPNPNLKLAVGAGATAGLTGALVSKAAANESVEKLGEATSEAADAGTSLINAVMGIFG